MSTADPDSERTRLYVSRSTEFNPAVVLIAIGKNAISAAMSTLGFMPKPNQTMKSGAIAITGSVCDATMIGFSPRASMRDDETATAIATPTRVATANPASTSWNVVHAAGRSSSRPGPTASSAIADGGG